jgi:hypothetical protein
VIGHDINARVGTRGARDEDCYNKVLGPYGIDRRNQKGKQLLNFLAVNKLKLMNSFFENSSYSTWSDIKTGDLHILDVWSTTESKIFRIRSCAVCQKFGLTNSAHTGVIAEIALVSIKEREDNRISAGVIVWKLIQTDECKNEEFNERLRELLENLPLYSYSEFGKCVMKAAQSTAMMPKRKRKGWFEESSETLQPLINQKYTALTKMKNVPEAIKPLWKEKLNECNRLVKEAVEVAKAKSVSTQAEKLNER